MSSDLQVARTFGCSNNVRNNKYISSSLLYMFSTPCIQLVGSLMQRDFVC